MKAATPTILVIQVAPPTGASRLLTRRMYWKPNATPADIKAMPKAVAIDIYRQKYWAKMDCDNRTTGPDFVDFDYGVNSGVGRVSKLRAKLDPLKLSPVDYVKRACAERSSFLHSLKTWQFFGAGWGNRVADVEATGVRMAVGASGKPVAPVLQQEASKAGAKTIAHSTGAATATVSLPSVHHWDFTTTIGAAILGSGLVILITYFIGNAVQNSHRASAYTKLASQPAQLK
jgi:lysozyme family protein